MADLAAGFTRARGPAGKLLPGWQGVLRRTPHSQPSWQCAHQHMASPSAVRCAAAELERRTQGEAEVFTLLRCAPCDGWLPDAGESACPRCGVPLERVKLAVLGRSGGTLTPASGKH